jgi:hypothetical protein
MKAVAVVVAALALAAPAAATTPVNAATVSWQVKAGLNKRSALRGYRIYAAEVRCHPGNTRRDWLCVVAALSAKTGRQLLDMTIRFNPTYTSWSVTDIEPTVTNDN